MLKCSTSLWSADLANLASEIRRVAPFSEMFHLDVADGHYVKNLLFFPDQVRALRPHTTLPLEVHLMTVNPLDWIEPFVDAGADRVIFCLDATGDPTGVITAIKARGKAVGVSLSIAQPVEAVMPILDRLDTLTIIGTELGIKGASMDPRVPNKIREARKAIAKRNLSVEIQADGGIRRETVPLIKAAGADYIVPGSLMFKENPETMRRWLAAC
ncbi:MAG TPA: ribulose-phosphate 3-epimerase [Verrucomicrobiae bacterium]|nr:ribulose-phosphate 3-epimerase [Verrucomicrobiae bacterium]